MSDGHQHAGMAHYKDLRDLYAKSLEYHGIGYALYQPIAATDMMPPCAGFFDRNGNFNLIAKLHAREDGHGLTPLEYMPRQQARVGIEWKPKTSLGVQAVTVDANGEGPNVGVPASAAGHIKYTSKSSFGAVVIASKPVTMTGYNDERLFLSWLDANKEILDNRFGKQLGTYGMWIVTQTHTAPGCWINAWYDKSSSAVVSVKAKANMLGELGQELNLDDQTSDRDWTHYTSCDDKGVVVFMDGIEVKPMEWRFDSFKRSIGLSRSSSASNRSDSLSPQPQAQVSTQRQARPDFLKPDHSTMRALSSSPPSAAQAARRASYVASAEPELLNSIQRQEKARSRSLSTHSSRPDRRSIVIQPQAQPDLTVGAEKSPTDEQMLKDLGISHPLSRSLSTISRHSVPRTPSLRRISQRLSPTPQEKHAVQAQARPLQDSQQSRNIGEIE